MTTTSRSHAFSALLFALLFIPIAVRAGDKQLNIQGKLTDTSGTPLTGSQTVTFRLYTSSTASTGSAIWTESQSLSLSSGLFNASLGTSTTMDSIPFNQTYYLGIQVAGDANELTPRQILGASAYAQGSLGNFNAGGAVLAAGQGVIAGTMTVQGSALSVGGAQFSVSAGSVTASGTLAVQGRSFTVGGSDFAVSNGSVTAGMVTSAGNAFIGGQGVVQGTMTVVGNAFSVGGATFSVAGASVTLGGRLNLAAAGIKWADGTTSTTASLGVAVSSVGIIPGLSTSNQISGVCVANSTRTLTGTASKVLVVFAGNTYNTNGSESFDLGVLRDGVKLGPGRSIGHNTAKAAPYYYDDDSFSFIDENVPPGTKNYCFWFAMTGNTGHLCNSGSGPCHFGVIEIR